MVTRRGHSLVELIVTLAFLGATFGAVAVAALAAARGAAASVHRQQALSSAAATLDSLVADLDPSDGEHRARGFVLTWTVVATGRGRVVRILARDERDREVAALDGFWAPLPPVLPVLPEGAP